MSTIPCPQCGIVDVEVGANMCDLCADPITPEKLRAFRDPANTWADVRAAGDSPMTTVQFDPEVYDSRERLIEIDLDDPDDLNAVATVLEAHSDAVEKLQAAEAKIAKLREFVDRSVESNDQLGRLLVDVRQLVAAQEALIAEGDDKLARIRAACDNAWDGVHVEAAVILDILHGRS